MSRHIELRLLLKNPSKLLDKHGAFALGTTTILLSALTYNSMTSKSFGTNRFPLVFPMLLYFPGFNVATNEDIKNVNYGMAIFTAACMGIGTTAGAFHSILETDWLLDDVVKEGFQRVPHPSIKQP